MRASVRLLPLVLVLPFGAGCAEAPTDPADAHTSRASEKADDPQLPTVQVGPADNPLTFQPASLTVKVGTTVQWVWGGNHHNVVSGKNGVADGLFCSPSNTNCKAAPISATGFTYQHTFTKEGTFPYFCTPHSSLGMKGTIIVEPGDESTDGGSASDAAVDLSQ